MEKWNREIIVVRSLSDSDMGLFEAHRKQAKSKQRALNINADVAARLLSPQLFEAKYADLRCICIFGDIEVRESRSLRKPAKNWRLGGNQIRGEAFARLDSKDFAIIRSVEFNDGSFPVTITFVSRKAQTLQHAGLVQVVCDELRDSMAVFTERDTQFEGLAQSCPAMNWEIGDTEVKRPSARIIPLMPPDANRNAPAQPKTIKEKLKSPRFMEHMFKAAGDLSAPAQMRFLDALMGVAQQLREVLEDTGRIVKVEKDHGAFWPKVSGQRTGFVDGGLANLSMLGSAPIAARVGGYTVVPGRKGEDREDFIELKRLIGEIYSSEADGLYDSGFPDISALRDAARISVEAAGAVQLLARYPDTEWLFCHGALVNPVSRYTDVMKDKAIRHRFPYFSEETAAAFLPETEPRRHDRDCSFIRVYLRQLQLLQSSTAVVCGVIEREATTNSVIRALIDSIPDDELRDLLPDPPAIWRTKIRNLIDPADDEDQEGQRITDSLLFRCILEPGEAITPVELDRNDARRRPELWRDDIALYPRPHISYLQVSEWSAPIRLEIFEKDLLRFREVADFILHCSALLPKYAFPVGLDIVDKFAKVPNWLSHAVSTTTAVKVMKAALDREDEKLFDAIRRMLCGSGREFLLRPGLLK